VFGRVDRNKYQIQIPLPPKIDPSVTMMTVEEKPDVTYNDIGGCKEQIEKMREVGLDIFCPFLMW
jgi:26S proteasome regulatory subunit T1